MKIAIASAVVFALAASDVAAQNTEAEAVFEVLGLEDWTLPQVAAAVARVAPDVTLAEAACAVILRDSLGFAQAAVETLQTDVGTWTTLSVVEPAQAHRVRIRVFPDSVAERPEWAGIRRILEEDPRALSALQDYSFLRGARDSLLWGPASPTMVAVRDEVSRVARQHGDSIPLWTLARDRNPQNRAIAPLILAHFPERETTWHGLVGALLTESTWYMQSVDLALQGMRHEAARPIDWAPIADDLQHLVTGTNLFAYTAVLETLTLTRVSLDVGRRLIALESPLLLDNLESRSPDRRATVRAFLRQAAGVDFGDDDARWAEWLRTTQAES